MKPDAKHDKHKDGEDESIARNPLVQSVVSGVTTGYLFKYEADNTKCLISMNLVEWRGKED